MPSYRVINKYIYRTAIVDLEMGKKADGSPNIVRQPTGLPQKVEVGTILDDVNPTELAAFSDRFELVTDEQAQAAKEQEAEPEHAPLRGVHEPVNALDQPIQKPPLTLDQAAKAAEIRLKDAQDRAMADTVEATRQRAAAPHVDASGTSQPTGGSEAHATRPAVTSPGTAPSTTQPASTTPPPPPPAEPRRRS